jgi:DNA-binding NtrC family response regulator
MPMGTILIVDSEKEMRTRLNDALNGLGYNVIDAADGETALSTVNGDGPLDLVITEYHIPGMHDLEFISTIRKARPRVPVIILTEMCSVETYIRAISLGVYEYMNKPVKEKELGRIVNTAIQRGQENVRRFAA